MLVATVEPSELQGPLGSSLLWSVTLVSGLTCYVKNHV